MKKTSKIIIIAIIIAVLLLGIGYAAIQNITLNIGGTLEADPNQANFVVRFTGTPAVSDASRVTATIVDDLNATIDVKDLTIVGESVTAAYTIENASEDLSTDLAVATINSNEEYFTIRADLGKTSLISKETTIVLVTATLTKAPLLDSVTATVSIDVTAMPVQPGEEGTSEGIKGSSQSPETTTLASLGVTNDNIGDYIDIGNDIIDFNGTTDVTTDDWRVLYVEGDKVYAILADYLPNSTTNVEGDVYVTTAGLGLYDTYSVCSNKGDVDELLVGLTNTTAWSELANGISGATVTGTPTPELFMSSYNTKNGTNLIYADKPTLDSTTDDYNLYVPHNTTIDNGACFAYWLAKEGSEADVGYCYLVSYKGKIGAEGVWQEEGLGVAIRPVIELPASTNAELVDGVWTISQ